MSGEPQSRRVRILIAEDDENSRRILVHAMENLRAEVACVADGLQAVEAYRTGVFDMVLMDLRMPNLDGYAATREIRAWETSTRRTHTPVVVVSAHTRSDEVAEARAAGADFHLGKPISVPMLLGTIDAILDARDESRRG